MMMMNQVGSFVHSAVHVLGPCGIIALMGGSV